MQRPVQYSTRRRFWVAVILSLPQFFTGCALFDHERWNLDRYRDERAVDIEQRLSADEPIVENPF